jgi:diacylglycerol kinase family enzyme
VLFNELDPFDVTLAFDGGEASPVSTLILAATNGPTYGGGFFICPDAVPDDGLFDVCMIDPLSLPEALVRLPFVIAGKHTRMRPVHMSRHSSFVIESPSPVPAQIDGEVLLEKRYEVRILPGAIECVVPRRG